MGCDKNTVDNEYLAGLLAEAGCEPEALDLEVTSDFEGMAAAVVTTCGFIGPAKEQSIESILELAEAKKTTGWPRRLLVAGCLSQRYGAELCEEIPEIDGLVGVGQFHRLAQMITGEGESTGEGPVAELRRPEVDIYHLMRRVRLEATPHAFLKISDGCNHTCTFCSIPAMKGKLRSVPPEILVAEARALIEQGVREINLVAQDLSMYGMDRSDWTRQMRLPELLRELCAIEGDFWIRCLYYYPGLVTDEFLDVMASEPKIVKYVDMPLQHLHPDVLRRMRRPFHEVKLGGLIERMRERVPGLVLRSTLITGFPGETDAEHAFVLEELKRLRLDRLGAFQYSPEDGTPASEAEDQIPEAVREQRWHEIMQTQQEIALELNAGRLDQRERVLIEGYNPELEAWQGRSSAEAPEIDGKVFISEADLPEDAAFEPGDFVDVTITETDVYDVWATL